MPGGTSERFCHGETVGTGIVNFGGCTTAFPHVSRVKSLSSALHWCNIQNVLVTARGLSSVGDCYGESAFFYSTILLVPLFLLVQGERIHIFLL